MTQQVGSETIRFQRSGVNISTPKGFVQAYVNPEGIRFRFDVGKYDIMYPYECKLQCSSNREVHAIEASFIVSDGVSNPIWRFPPVLCHYPQTSYQFQTLFVWENTYNIQVHRQHFMDPDPHTKVAKITFKVSNIRYSLVFISI